MRSRWASASPIQIAPDLLPTDGDEICARHHIRPGTPWIELICGVDEFQRGFDTALRVGPVGPDNVDGWASVTLRAFGMPLDALARTMVAGAADPNFRPFAARASEAIDAGCRWLVAESGKPAEGEVNSSLNNLQRRGLRPLHDRQNWIWSPVD